jgi:hypothetical protein
MDNSNHLDEMLKAKILKEAEQACYDFLNEKIFITRHYIGDEKTRSMNAKFTNLKNEFLLKYKEQIEQNNELLSNLEKVWLETQSIITQIQNLDADLDIKINKLDKINPLKNPYYHPIWKEYGKFIVFNRFSLSEVKFLLEKQINKANQELILQSRNMNRFIAILRFLINLLQKLPNIRPIKYLKEKIHSKLETYKEDQVKIDNEL